MRRPAPRLRTPIAALLAAALAGCGTSAEDEARQQTCDARDDIADQVDGLQELTPATLTTEEVGQRLDAIRTDRQTIGDAAPEMAEDTRSEIEAANDQFRAEIHQVASTVLRSTPAADAKAQAGAALEQLAGVYRKSLGTIDCS